MKLREAAQVSAIVLPSQGGQETQQTGGAMAANIFLISHVVEGLQKGKSSYEDRSPALRFVPTSVST